jgi:agmatine deiminase
LHGKKGNKTISDGFEIAQALGINCHKSNIILDGGNVIKLKNKVILCDKVLKENKSHSRDELLSK